MTNNKIHISNDTCNKFSIRKLLSKITFFWIIPYLNENLLNKKDLFELTGDHLEDFDREIQFNTHEFKQNGLNTSNSFFKKILCIKKNLILKVLFLKLGHVLFASIFSISLSKFMNSNTSSESIGIGFKVIIFYIFRLIFESQNRVNSGKLSLEIESLLIKWAYSRLIFDNKESINSKSSNIMSIILSDCSSFPNLIVSILDLLIFPVRFFMTWFLLKEQVGSVATYAVVTFLIVFLLGFILQIVGSALKSPFMKYRDLRISKTHEFLRNIVSLKLVEQEYILKNQIFEIRKKETFYNRIRLVLIQIGTYLDYHVQNISQFVLFISYIPNVIENSNNEMTSLKKLGSTGVTILNIFFSVSSIRGLPSQLIESFISMKRLQTLFNESNNSYQYNNNDADFDHFDSNEIIIKINNTNDIDYNKFEKVDFKNNDSTIQPLLKTIDFETNNFKNVDLEIKNGEKVFFIGESGSGKTTFIQFLLSKKYSYRKYVYHLKYDLPIGYVSQISWIPSGSIRSIILFGSVFQESIYKQVIECCNLLTDFKQWKDGDLKIVNEGGDTLSKGQKARICIARTLYYFLTCNKYKDCPFLFIFDDIFSNLDQFVANKIFYNLFNSKGLLSKSTIITTIDKNSLSSFLNYSSNLDSESSINYYHSFQYFYIDNFNILSDQYIVPYQVIINNMESIFTDKFNNKFSKNDSMIFSPIRYDSKEYLKDKEYILPINHQNFIETEYINEKKVIHINSLKEVVTKKGYISISSYKWYLLNIGKYHTLIILFLAILKSSIERFSELLFTGQSSKIDTLKKFLFLYTFFSIIGLIFGILLFLYEAIACTLGSDEIHKKLFNTISSKISQVIPIHFSINHIGGDMLIVDTCIVKSIISTMFPLLIIIGQSLFILYTYPHLTPFLLIWIMIFVYRICIRFITSYREYQRFSLSLFSSICGIFSGSQLGGSTIFFLKKQDVLINQAQETIDLFIKIKYIQLVTTQWAGFWMNMVMTPIGILLNIITLKIMLLTKENSILAKLNFPIQSGSVIICIYYFLSIAESISTFMYKFVQMEKEMCSIEHILNFIEIFTSLEEHFKMNEIPQYKKELFPIEQGLIIENLDVSTLRYFDPNHYKNDRIQELGYDHLLKVEGRVVASPGDIIGIIGRTGSGKSSLVNSIMNLYTQINGTILLNNVNTKLISRKNDIIGLLPQECLLIQGTTIRNLLDPLSEYSDSIIISTLKKYNLFEFINLLPLKLETLIICDENFNFDFTYNKNNSIKLSTSQIRYLSFVYFLINPFKYQLLLIDEPPYKVMFSFNNITFDTISIHSIIRSNFSHCPALIVTHNVEVFEYCDIFWIIKNKKLNKVICKKIDNCSKLIWNELK